MSRPVSHGPAHMPHSCLYLRGTPGGNGPAVSVQGLHFHRAQFVSGMDNKLTRTQMLAFVEGSIDDAAIDTTVECSIQGETYD